MPSETATAADRPVWLILAGGKVVPEAAACKPPAVEVRYWCREGDREWTAGDRLPEPPLKCRKCGAPVSVIWDRGKAVECDTWTTSTGRSVGAKHHCRARPTGGAK